MPTQKPESIDAYLAGFPAAEKLLLEKVRSTMLKAAPGAEETISYGVPALKLKGRNLVYFAGFKNHISVYPAPRENDAFREELTQYKGGKGTVQFPLDKPIPFGLITRIVQFRIRENEALALKKKTK